MTYIHVYPRQGGGVVLQYWHLFSYDSFTEANIGAHGGDWDAAIHVLLDQELKPADVLASLRSNWVNLHAAAQKRGGPPPGVTLTTPAQTPIAQMALPAAVKTAMEEQQKPDATVTWTKLIHAVDSKIVSALDDGSPLPDDSHLVHVQVVTTSVSAAAVHVDAYILVGTAETEVRPHPVFPGPVNPEVLR